MGRFADRLAMIAQSQVNLFDMDSTLSRNVASELEQAREQLAEIREMDLFGGQLDPAIRAKIGEYTRYIDSLSTAVEQSSGANDDARNAVVTAQQAHAGLPAVELTPWERFYTTAGEVIVGGVLMPGPKFGEALLARREQEREQQALEALRALQSSVDASAERSGSFDIPELEDLPDYHHEFEPNPTTTGTTSPPGTGTPPGVNPPPPGVNDPTNPEPPTYDPPVVDPPVTPDPPSFEPPEPPTFDPPVTPDPPTFEPPVEPDFPELDDPDYEVPSDNNDLPPTKDWPLTVDRPGVSQDGITRGGYQLPVNPNDAVPPRDPAVHSWLQEQQRAGMGGLGLLSGAAIAGGIGGALATRPGLSQLGARGIGGRPGMAGMPGATAAPANGRSATGGAARGTGTTGARPGAGGVAARPGMAGMPGATAAPANSAQTKNGAKNGNGTGRAAAGRTPGATGFGGRPGMAGMPGSAAPASGSQTKNGTNAPNKNGGKSATSGRAGSGRGMVGAPLANATRAEKKKSARERTEYGKSGIVFFDHDESGVDQEVLKAGRPENTVIRVQDEDDRW
ncbi:hypothetical protein [Citricoccus sp. NR2]|uniref:hypothetical protein n=1 Tax=Citricoccus sp. NR2 TaxID=3004095 RepID=UPI0022DDF5A8|nr:hypothetical protein [Citricoccus sp. NR2]WBL19687.1 hypothetical protein O1A05_03045 [Citricoccus sp. NR2]